MQVKEQAWGGWRCLAWRDLMKHLHLPNPQVAELETHRTSKKHMKSLPLCSLVEPHLKKNKFQNPFQRKTNLKPQSTSIISGLACLNTSTTSPLACERAVHGTSEFYQEAHTAATGTLEELNHSIVSWSWVPMVSCNGPRHGGLEFSSWNTETETADV